MALGCFPLLVCLCGSIEVAQAGLDLTTRLPWPPECWDYRHVSHAYLNVLLLKIIIILQS
jgi:hypothetical protein